MKSFCKPIVFLGPTLKRATAETLCDAEFRPPAAMGDITRATCETPDVIILIDGVFEDQPSVWHKEILWALSRGIVVIGASSMGALRAAELSDYGMMGHGEVFNTFSSGRLNDDDEVAVVHCPAELDWLPLSDAMIDIRDFVSKAVSHSVLNADEAALIVFHAKAQHFKTRSLKSSVHVGLKDRRTTKGMTELLDWFSNCGPGVKDRDCRSLLSCFNAVAAAARETHFHVADFNPTIYLRRLEEFGFEQIAIAGRQL